MNKQEYLNIKFKRDFLQYCLLQEDSLLAVELANKLYKMIDLLSFIDKYDNHLEALCNKHLSFDAMLQDGKLSNDFPAALELSIQDTIISEFQSFLSTELTMEHCELLRSAIVYQIEKLSWANGISEIPQSLQLFIERLKRDAQYYAQMHVEPIEESVFLAAYNKAKEQTLLERIQQNNNDDIIAYRNILIEDTEIRCKNLVSVAIAQVFEWLATEELFQQLHAHFLDLQHYAHELQESLPTLEVNSDWDAEYNKLVPTDFYYRNVEGITAEQAFYMTIFQFFAKNEEWLMEQGMLVDRELCVYTNLNKDTFGKIFQKYTEQI